MRNGTVEVLGAFDLAAGPHVQAYVVMLACRSEPISCSTSLVMV